MKKTQMKAAEKVQRPVSEKFYDDMRGRVFAACSIVGNMYGYSYDIPQAVEDMLGVIDSYMAGEITPEDCKDVNTRLVLNILRAEIDRAMERSAKARARSFRRRKSMTSGRQQSVSELTESAAETRVDNYEDKAEPAPAAKPMNRRQRRQIEQELRREARKEMRRLAAQTSEEKAGVAV